MRLKNIIFIFFILFAAFFSLKAEFSPDKLAFYYSRLKNNVDFQTLLPDFLQDLKKGNQSVSFYQFIKFLNKLPDSGIAKFEGIILELLIRLEKGEFELSKSSQKIIKEKLLYYLSLINYKDFKDISHQNGKEEAEYSGGKIKIYLNFQLRRYTTSNYSLISYLKDRIKSKLSEIKRFNIYSDKSLVVAQKIKIDYILTVAFYPYQYAIRNYFNRYQDKDDRTYYLYDYSDLDIDIRIDYRVKRVEDGKLIGYKKAFFTESGTLNLYPGDYRFYHEVPYVWNYGKEVDIFDRYSFSLHDNYYNPYFNEVTDTVEKLVRSVLIDRKEGLLAFLLRVFPVKAKVIFLDKNPDFVWIDKGKDSGIFYKTRFVLLRNKKEVGILRARTLYNNKSKCRFYGKKGSLVKPKIGDLAITKGY